MVRVLLLACLLSLRAFSATFYIDFASGSDSNAGSKVLPWKYAPGMASFSGTYSHSAGDQIVFKGGVTWPDPASANWRITSSGSSGNPDYYGVDKTWYSGDSWSQPIFDGGSQNPVAFSPYWRITGSYITMDNFRVQNIGIPNVNQGNYGIQFNNMHDLLVENMTLVENSRIALMVQIGTGTTLSNYTFVGNDISAASWGISAQAVAVNTVVENVVVHHNSIHDFHSQIAGGQHADGVFLGSSAATTEYVSNVSIYDNYFYGDWTKSDGSAAGTTGFVYCSGCGNNISIFNNYGSDTASTSGYVFEVSEVSFPQGTVSICNNTFVMDTAGGWEGFVYDYDSTGLILENNVYVGGVTVLYLPGPNIAAGLVSNFNDFYGWTSAGTMAKLGATLYNFAGYKALGYESNGLNVNPSLTGWAPTSGSSPIVGAAANLTSLNITALNSDAAGTPRPAFGAWDIGAYQFVPTATISGSFSGAWK